MPVWEDAIQNGLIAVVPSGGGIGQYAVNLTAKGRDVLDGYAA
jgi:hypothetical protein